MSLYDKIKPLKEAGKTFAEIAATQGLNDDPRLVPLADLNEILLASGAWAVLTASDNPLAATTLGLFGGKLNNFDARKYGDMMLGVLELLAGQVLSKDIRTIKEMCGVGLPNPTAEEIEAAWNAGQWNDARYAVEAEIDARFAALTDAYNAAKNTLGALTNGSTIPTAQELWA